MDDAVLVIDESRAQDVKVIIERLEERRPGGACCERASRADRDRLTAWMREHALPLWGRRARDHRGGFYEAMLP